MSKNQVVMLEIVKAISVNAKIILMDEPTSSLTENEVDFLFKKIFELRASGITVMDVCPENVTVTSLLTTSDSAYSKSDVLDGGSIEYSEGDLSGPFSIGVAAEYAAESGETGRVVWFSSPGLMSADMDSIVSGANSDLVLNAISYLTGEESGVSIHAKSLTSQSLTVSSSAASFWSWVMIAVLPLAAIAAGVAVTVWRKRR